MSIIRRRNHEVPSLNTASLPDLIFAILFFFMIVTHMRKVNLKVRYKTPQGTELTHLSRKTNTTYIFIGQPVGTTQAANTAQSLGSAQSQQDAAVCIQVNDKVVSLDELSAFLQREQRQARKSGEAQQLTVCLKADRHAPHACRRGCENGAAQGQHAPRQLLRHGESPLPRCQPLAGRGKLRSIWGECRIT